MQPFGVIGNEKNKAYLAACFAGERVPHAFLLTGPEGSGKHTLARRIAAGLLCVGDKSKAPCGECEGCRKVGEAIHPDVSLVEPAGATFKIDQVREIRSAAYIAPNEGAVRVFILAGCETMQAAAQNALLKIIEEPPAAARFILLCSDRAALLPTVLSRVTELQMEELSSDVIAKELAARYPDRKSDEIRAASGAVSLGRAISLLEEANTAKLADSYFSALSKGDELSLAECTTALEKINRQECKALLDAVDARLIACLTWQSGMAAAQIPSDDRKVAEKLTKTQIFAIIKVVRRCGEYLRYNVGQAHIMGMLSAGVWEATH